MSPTTQELDSSRWAEYFDSIAAGTEGLLVTIEVMSEQLGDQLEAERLPLAAIAYDRRDDVLEVAVGGHPPRFPVVLRHLISNPRSVEIEDTGRPSPSAILITDADGVKTLVRLFEPEALAT